MYPNLQLRGAIVSADLLPKNASDRLIESVRIKCPFCNGTAHVGHMQSDGEGAVLHTLPMCEKFEQLPPDEYLQAVRVRLSD